MFIENVVHYAQTKTLNSTIYSDIMIQTVGIVHRILHTFLCKQCCHMKTCHSRNHSVVTTSNVCCIYGITASLLDNGNGTVGVVNDVVGYTTQ